MIQVRQPFCMHTRETGAEGGKKSGGEEICIVPSCPATRQNDVGDAPCAGFQQRARELTGIRNRVRQVFLSLANQHGRTRSGGAGRVGPSTAAGRDSCCTRVRFCDRLEIAFFSSIAHPPASAIWCFRSSLTSQLPTAPGTKALLKKIALLNRTNPMSPKTRK